jgi:S1-C subfamily serine protease
MKHLLALFLLASLSGCGLLGSLAAPRPAVAEAAPKVDVVARAVVNTVALTTPEGERFCSGVAAEGIIITAAHCVDGSAFKVLYKGGLYPGVVINVDVAADIALVDAVGARLTDTVPLAEKAPVLGSKVIWTGYPLGRDFIMGTGIVGNPEVQIMGVTFTAVYGQFIYGNSGGPVFNSKGNLIGIVAMTMVFRGDLLPVGYAVPLSTIKATLN